MRHQQNRRPLFLQQLQRRVADAVAQPVVEARERLVHQHHARPRRQRAGQRHALLLAARQLVRMLRPKPARFTFSSSSPTRRAAFGLRAPAGRRPRFPPPSDAGTARSPGTSARPTAPRAAGHAAASDDHLAVDQHLARIRPLDPGDHPQRRRLAAARRAEQAGHLPRRHRQRHVIAPPAARRRRRVRLRTSSRSGGSVTSALISDGIRSGLRGLAGRARSWQASAASDRRVGRPAVQQDVLPDDEARVLRTQERAGRPELRRRAIAARGDRRARVLLRLLDA